ncbi:MAG: hypothetical protein WBI41_05745 [Azovibrio sp.]|uniref:hypothetical protein n=1 Tax=Azovibrio sp. TaxID=1872673 RepID=UPI003C759975
MDDVDLTTEREAKMMELMRRGLNRSELEPTGFCHFCSDPVEHPKKFCDGFCADDFEKEKKMNKLMGNRDET